LVKVNCSNTMNTAEHVMFGIVNCSNTMNTAEHVMLGIVNCSNTMNTAEHVMLGIVNYIPNDKICIIYLCNLPWRLRYAINSCLF
jgi:hypothetical protein